MANWMRIAYLSRGRKACKLYIVWDGMWARCINPRANSYHTYGGKGVRVCLDWEDYGNFRAWAIANGFRKGLTLDRKDSAGDYEPNNCRWTTPAEQQWNTCRTIHLTLNGITKPLPQWSDELGISRELLRARRSSGWTDEQILTTPVLGRGHVRAGVKHKPRGRHAPRTLFSANEGAKP